MDGIILFSDDHIYSSDRPEGALFEALRVELPVLGVHTLDLAAEAVKSVASFRALILDWQYSDQEEEDNFGDVAEELGEKAAIKRPAGKDDAALKFLQENDFYSLIYIYSELDINETYGEALRAKFGDRVRIKRKDENFTVGNIQEIKNTILQEIEQWKADNRNLAVPIMWSAAINESIQKIFKELASADSNWLKELYDSAAHDGVDPELFVIELLQLLLGEAVIQNKELIDAILQIGQQPATAIADDKIDVHRKSLSKLFSRLYYSELKDTTPIMTGDIYKLDEGQYGIVITPECDISYIKKTEGCEFELLTFSTEGFDQFIQQNNSATKAEYAGYNNNRKDGVRKIFNQEMPRVHILPSIPLLDPDCKASCIIDFRVATRRILAKELLVLPRSFKINSPFIQQLRQRYLSHIGRVGTAALPTHVRDWNLG